LEQKDAMDEILRIRQRQGDLFEGSIFAELNRPSEDSTPADHEADQFAQALQRVMQRHSEVTVIPAAGASLTERCEAAYTQATAIPDSLEIEDSPFSRALRRSARLLDRRANDLEDQLMYVEADRLRDLATQLRTEARSPLSFRQTPRSGK